MYMSISYVGTPMPSSLVRITYEVYCEVGLVSNQRTGLR